MMRSEAPTRTPSEQLLEDLLDRVRPVMAQTVDALQVAALLESDGITDEGARIGYGFDDVFHLATEVRHRCVPAASPHPVLPRYGEPGGGVEARSGADPGDSVRRSWPLTWDLPGPDATTLRLVSHGVLYLLPATLFPPVLAVLGSGTLLLGLVIGGGLAWVWAGASTWMAYQLLSARRPEAAAQVLRLASLGGLIVAAATGYAVAESSGHGPGIAAVATAQMAYQMGATVLMFHRREGLLLAVMVPGVVVGVVAMASATLVSTTVALAVGALSVLAVLAFSLAVRHPTGDRASAAAWTAVHGDPAQFVLVVLYTGLTAAYLLHAQMRYMLGSIEVSIGLLPLIVGMGVVELRAYRFRLRARSLMRSVRYPREFAVGIRWILLQDLAVVALTVAGLGVSLLGALALCGEFSPAGAVMTGASILLASAYYVSFLMTGMAMLGPLCTAVALAIGAHVIAVAVIPEGQAPLIDTTIFAATALLLLLISLMAVLPAITDPRTH